MDCNVMKRHENDDAVIKKQKKVILLYRTARSLFPASSVPRGAVWALQWMLCNARCCTVPHRAVPRTAG
jgi:hypothetical protein